MTLNKFLELISSVLAVIGIVLISFGHSEGWIVSFVANISMLVLCFRLGLVYLLIMNICFLMANMNGMYRSMETMFLR